MGFFSALVLLIPGFASAGAYRTITEFEASAKGKIKVAFLDADSTIRVSGGQWFAPANVSEICILPGVAKKIRKLNEDGYFVAVISNQQTMVNRIGEAKIEEIMQATIRGAEAAGGRVNYFDYSLNDAEKKPSRAMGDRLETKLKEAFGSATTIDREKSFMVGDAAYLMPLDGKAAESRPDGRPGFDFGNYDRVFAENNGIQFEEPQGFFGWDKDGVDRFHRPKDVAEYWKKKGKNKECEPIPPPR